jgi:poly(3-hydroxyalkanoate) synthetase
MDPLVQKFLANSLTVCQFNYNNFYVLDSADVFSNICWTQPIGFKVFVFND